MRSQQKASMTVQRSLPGMQTVSPGNAPARPLIARQDGAALVTVMFLAAVMLTLIVMASRETQTELRIAHNDQLAQQALNVAEAGLNHAFSLAQTTATSFHDELSSGGTGGKLADLGTLTTLNGVSYRFRAFGGGASDGYYVKLTDNYDETSGADDPTKDQDNTITILSRGRVGSAERVVTATMTGQTRFPSILFGKLFVSISSSSAYTDSYNSSVAPYSKATAGTNGSILSNGDIDLGNSHIVVNGDATAGGTVDIGGSTVTGTITDGAPPLSFPSVPPCGPPYSSGAGLSGSKGSYNYDSTTGVLSVKGFPTLAAGSYCFSSISESSGGTLKVTGPSTIYVTDLVNLGGGGILNATTIPGDLQLLSSFVSSGNGVVLSGGSNAYMAVYAPDCGVKLTGGTDFFGSIVGGSITMSGNSGLHYDEALGTILTGNCKLSNWREARN
jgi:hypothetical protein